MDHLIGVGFPKDVADIILEYSKTFMDEIRRHIYPKLTENMRQILDNYEPYSDHIENTYLKTMNAGQPINEISDDIDPYGIYYGYTHTYFINDNGWSLGKYGTDEYLYKDEPLSTVITMGDHEPFVHLIKADYALLISQGDSILGYDTFCSSDYSMGNDLTRILLSCLLLLIRKKYINI